MGRETSSTRIPRTPEQTTTTTKVTKSSDMSTHILATHDVFLGDEKAHHHAIVFYDGRPQNKSKNKINLVIVPATETNPMSKIDMLAHWEVAEQEIYCPYPTGKTYLPKLATADESKFTVKRGSTIIAGSSNDFFSGTLIWKPLTTNLVNEGMIMERITSCPVIPHCFGFVVERERVVGLALSRYDQTLMQKGRAGLSDEFKRKVKDEINRAVTHLAGLGVAHNNITPENIGIENGSNIYLINFHSCTPHGTDLKRQGLKTGTPGWGNYTKSSSENDKDGLKRVIDWMDGK